MKFYLKNILRYLLAGLGLFFSFLMFMIVYPYFSFRYDVDFLLTKQAILHLLSWRIAFYTHISSSLLVLITGVFQFIKPLLIRKPRLHRLLGKTYILLVLGVSAPSGLMMAFYANGGWGAKISFMILSILWWLFTYLAYQYIRKKNFKLHLEFMYRSYALTLSAITLRTYVFFLPGFLNLHGKDMYIFVSWLSWIPNLLVAELLVRYVHSYKDYLLQRGSK